MAREPDDNTLDNAGETGQILANALSGKVTEAIDGFPTNDRKQKAAIARIVANSLYDYSDEQEG